MTLREYSGNAKATTLNGGISAAATSIAVADATGYPTGASGPFVITIDAGLTAEEKVLCASRTGNTLTASVRGWDGTSAADHDNAASVQHTFSATDAREANQHVNDTTGDPHPQYAAALADHEADADPHPQYGLAAASARVLTSQSTTNGGGFTDLATVGPAATVEVGASGMALVTIACGMNMDITSRAGHMSFAVSGATTLAASSERQLAQFTPNATEYAYASATYLLTGLTPGSTTFTAKYQSDGTGNTATFRNREIAVVAL